MKVFVAKLVLPFKKKTFTMECVGHKHSRWWEFVFKVVYCSHIANLEKYVFIA